MNEARPGTRALLGGVAVKDRTPGKLIDLTRAQRDKPTGD